MCFLIRSHFRPRIGWLIFTLTCLMLTASCKKFSSSSGASREENRGAPKDKIKFPVEVMPVQLRRVEYAVSAVGSIEAFERVQITARVAGAVEKVRFAEGELVKAGQALVEIEPARYQLAVKSARATLEKLQAAQADAEAGLRRRKEANAKAPGSFAKEEIETWETKTRTSAADLAQAQVALEQAALNLRDAYVRTPVKGTILTRTVQTGQYIQTGTVLATIVRRDPLLLRFMVREQEAMELKTQMIAYFHLKYSQKQRSAKITQVAEAAEESSRMVAVTAEIVEMSEENDPLRPGTFVEVTVPFNAQHEAPVIPQTAVRPSDRGFLAYVLAGNIVEERILQLGMRTAGGLVEVRNGLSVGENLVIRGNEALRDQAPITVVKQTALQEISPSNGGNGSKVGNDGKGDNSDNKSNSAKSAGTAP